MPSYFKEEVDHLRELSASQAQDLAKNKLRVKELEEREIALIGNVITLLDILCIHMLVLKEMKKYQCFHFNLQFIWW